MEHTYTLRPLRDRDAERMLEWMRNDDVTRFLQIGGSDTTIDSVKRFIASAQDESENLHRAIVDENDVYYGTVSLKHINREKAEAEYAIALHMDGIGTGAARQGSEQLFAIAAQLLRLKRVYLYVRKDNKRAVKFYSKGPWQLYKSDNSEEQLLWFEMLFG